MRIIISCVPKSNLGSKIEYPDRIPVPPSKRSESESATTTLHDLSNLKRHKLITDQTDLNRFISATVLEPSVAGLENSQLNALSWFDSISF
jgi:hypothetical protein